MKMVLVLSLLLAPLLLGAAQGHLRPQMRRPKAAPAPAVQRLSEAGVQKARVFEGKLVKPVHFNYLLHLPGAYAQNKKERFPLILFLHGMGERGLDPARVKVHGPPKIADQDPNFPFIVVSPQCAPGEFWSSDSLILLLDEVQRKYRVDPDRVYLTGLSMGGFGSWNLAFSHPERFAAVVPICGGGNFVMALTLDKKRAEALKALPFWVFHGAKDPTVKVEESERMVNFLKRFGGQVQFTVYPEAAHDSWTETYKNPELYRWLLQQRRKPPLVVP